MTVGHHPAVGYRGDPCVLRSGDAQERVRSARRPQVHGQGAPLAAPQHVQAHIGGDADSQDRTGERPSKVSSAFHARPIASWTASSASNADPSIR